MFVPFYQRFQLPFLNVDDGAGGSGGSSEGDTGEGDTGEGGSFEPITSQDQLNRVIGSRIAKVKTQAEKLQSQLEAVKQEKRATLEHLKELEQNHSLSEEQREKNRSKIQELENSLMTEKERAEKRAKELSTKHQKELKALEDEKDTWRSRYENSSIERAIKDAALEHGAKVPNQIFSMLRGNTKLEEIVEDGQATGRFQSVTTIMGYGEDGENVTDFTLPTAEAIAKMREDGLNDNLFDSKQKAGTGRGGRTGTQRYTADRPPVPADFGGDMDAFKDAYDDWRKKFLT
ncbi:MAG: hypothetical protein CL489_06115 [Acidobacteria bacterium]|nr:hypothetical protein [Acidobacteriota bacterium]|tara:strand:+ start:14699 stop:15565 length:867 start_codon:yes stop_codon:yes gene_type:complete